MLEDKIGPLVAIYRTASPFLGCSCEHHSICGTVVHLDMLVKFKRTLVTTGKSPFKDIVLHNQQFTHHFRLTENNEYKTVLAAFWITKGVCRCIVGHVPESFAAHFNRLEDRVGQIVTIYSFSSSPSKIAFSNTNFGVCHAILVDKPMPGDSVIDTLVETIDSDDDSE